MMRLSGIIAPVALLALLFGVWEAICRLADIPAYFLPPPSAIAAALVSDFPSLLVGAWRTLSMALVALLVASLTAQGLALTAAMFRSVERTVRPLAVMLQVTPVIAIAPLVVIWSGVDHPERAIVALAAVAAFFPIFSGAMTGLSSADPDLERLFDLYDANRLQRLARLKLPSAVPFLLEGHKVAAGLAVIGAVVAEFVAGSGASQGLAWRILEAGNRLQTARMFAALVALGLLGAGLHAALAFGERAGLRWWRGR